MLNDRALFADHLNCATATQRTRCENCASEAKMVSDICGPTLSASGRQLHGRSGLSSTIRGLAGRFQSISMTGNIKRVHVLRPGPRAVVQNSAAPDRQSPCRLQHDHRATRRIVVAAPPVSIPRQEPEFGQIASRLVLRSGRRAASMILRNSQGPFQMSKEETNKTIVARWFTEFWGKEVNLAVVDEIAAPDMLLKYSLHEPRRGRADIRAFMTDFRAAFPDLNFWGTADLIADGDYVVGQWEGGGTHTGPAFNDFLIGGLPAATGRRMHFTGTTVLKVIDGKIVQEIGLDDGVTALTQLGLIRAA